MIVSNIIKELIYSKKLLNWDLFCIQIFVEKKFLRFVSDFYLIPYTEVPRFADLKKMFTRSHFLRNLARSLRGVSNKHALSNVISEKFFTKYFFGTWFHWLMA